MSLDTKDFYGKNVAEAIKNACDDFGVPQENLTIEVLETGSKGIFGLIRQKAHIRAKIQEIDEEPADRTPEPEPDKPKQKARKKKPAKADDRRDPKTSQPDQQEEPVETAPAEPEPSIEDSTPEVSDVEVKVPAPLSEQSLALIKDELETLLTLMDCPSTVTVADEGGTAHCRVSDEHQELLVSQEGRVLDSLQYLLRKIISKKVSGRIQLTIDVGDFREKRYQELQDRAIEFAALVKQDGKTQVIPSLNPSERRIVHVALQDDPDIRSRSVGEGLFKKVLIYKPGKGKKNNNRKRGRSRQRKKSTNGPNPETS